MRTKVDSSFWLAFGLLSLVTAGCATGASPFSSERTSEPSTVRFRTFDVADSQGCGVTVDGGIVCWGTGPAVGESPASNDWRAVEVTDEFACGVNTSGSLRCWGAAPTLAGGFDSGTRRYGGLALGRDVCGLTEEGDVVCQGIGSGEVLTWEGRFSDISSGAVATCGLARDKDVVCARGDGRSRRFFEERDDITAVKTFGNSVCVLDGGQAVRCRSLQTGERIPTPTGRYVSVDGRGRNRCALGTGGEAVCWPIGSRRGTRISGPFKQIQAGDGFVCGRIEGGYIICRGGDGSGGDTPPATSMEESQEDESEQVGGET